MAFYFLIKGQYQNCSEAYYTQKGKHMQVAEAFMTVKGKHVQVFRADSGNSGDSEYHIVCSINPNSTLPSSYSYEAVLEINGDRYDISEPVSPGTHVILTLNLYGDTDMWVDSWNTNLDYYDTYDRGTVIEFTMPSYNVTLSAIVNCESGDSDQTYYDITYGSQNATEHIFTSTPQASAYYGEEVRFEADGVTEGSHFEIIGRNSGINYGSPTAMAGGEYFLFTMPAQESIDILYYG